MPNSAMSLLQRASQAAWAIQRPKLDEIMALLVRRAFAGDQTPSAAWDKDGPARASHGDSHRVGAIVVIPVFGTLVPRGNALNSSGMTSCERLSRELAAAVADPNVSAVVLDVNSPGGSVQGTMEFADEVRAARDKKRIVAVANGTAASAAYWIGSQATEFTVVPSGWVGSIGVLVAHQDLSGALEKEGVKITLISSTPEKVESAPTGPLSDEALAHIQQRVDQYYAQFVSAIAAGRGVSESVVRETFGRGRMVMADEASGLGMVDRVETIGATLSRLMGAGKQGTTVGNAEGRAAVERITQSIQRATPRSRA